MPQTIFVSATPQKYEQEHADQVAEQLVRPTGLVDPVLHVRPVATQVDDLLAEAHARADKGERVLVTTLTKRMAEDLTDYLNETASRRAICTATSTPWSVLRSSAICASANLMCWSASTCCARASTSPRSHSLRFSTPTRKVSLRAERSLIQTIGRAARHINGTAILYADSITDSMKKNHR